MVLLCSGLNEIGSHRLISSNTWSLVGETVWEGSSDVSTRLGVDLRYQKHPAILSTLSLLLLCGLRCDLSPAAPTKLPAAY